VIVDVGKKIFIRRDAERGRSILPFDCERAACMNIGKSANRAFIGFDIAVASNSDPAASGGQKDTGKEKYDRDLLHVKLISIVAMRLRLALDSEKSSRRLSQAPCGPESFRGRFLLTSQS
jgi:hypothetical protein